MNNAGLKNKIKWRSRRGMLELDLLFKYFNQQMLNSLSSEQLSTFSKLLDQDDNLLESWLLHGELPTDEALKSLCQKIRDNALLHT